jgi:hypothetical protein
MRFKITLKVISLSLLFLFFSTFVLNATIRYVSKTGSSTPPYTSWATAADSIMECMNISVFGDTIYVANGIYKERIDMIDGLTLIGAGMDSCIIDTRTFPLTSPFYSIETGDSCYISNFEILTYDLNNGTGIRQRNSIVEYCRIQYAATGITINAGFQNKPSASKNIILQVTDGIITVFAQSIIKENIIYPRRDGLISQLNSSPIYLNNTVILSNAVNTSSGFDDFNDNISTLKNNLFITLDNSGDLGIQSYYDTLTNNVVIGPWDYGIFTAGSVLSDAVIKNNHIEGALTGLRYDAGSGGPPPVFQYNNLWDNQANFQNFTADTTNIYNDPMFVNEDSMDFHLQMFSPLIDAGDPDILDLDGSRSDIGLYGGPFGEIYTYQDLAPKPPRNLTAEVDSIIKLRWNKNTEADFNYYNLYRDTVKNFTIDTTKLVASVTDTFYHHIIPAGVESLYFKLAGVDNQGNESNPSEEISIILVSVKEEWQAFNNFVLYQNYPNPFNPSTKIGYKLKERGYVKLYVYDVKGELVSVLVNQTQEAGYYEVEFSGETKDERRKTLASGIYIYQIMIKNENSIPVFSDIKKMILLK